MVADRECDIYELYVRRQERPLADFIVRACRDRALLDGRHLFERLYGAPLLGGFDLEVERKQQRVKIKESRLLRVRESRLAKMEVRAMPVYLRPPQRKGLKLPEVELCAVLVAEKNPPEGQAPIEWLLLTTLPAQDFEQAMRIVRAYTQRWLVEEFHRVLKSGCRIEALTLRGGGALLALARKSEALRTVLGTACLAYDGDWMRCVYMPGQRPSWYAYGPLALPPQLTHTTFIYTLCPGLVASIRVANVLDIDGGAWPTTCFACPALLKQ